MFAGRLDAWAPHPVPAKDHPPRRRQPPISVVTKADANFDKYKDIKLKVDVGQFGLTVKRDPGAQIVY